MKTIFAIIYGQFEAIHRWEQAPISEGYLRNPHRHMFYVEVQIQQMHNRRDIEYYAFKKLLQKYLNSMEKPLDFSCEDYADQIYEYLSSEHLGRSINIKVTEDNLEGVLVQYQ